MADEKFNPNGFDDSSGTDQSDNNDNKNDEFKKIISDNDDEGIQELGEDLIVESYK